MGCPVSLELIDARPARVSLWPVVRDRRARLWVAALDAWSLVVLAGEPVGLVLPAALPPLRRLRRALAAGRERTVVICDEADVPRARAWVAELGDAGAAVALWAAVAVWSDAAAEQSLRRERGGAPWGLYREAALAVAEVLGSGADVLRAADALAARMDGVEARLWGRMGAGR